MHLQAVATPHHESSIVCITAFERMQAYDASSVIAECARSEGCGAAHYVYGASALQTLILATVPSESLILTALALLLANLQEVRIATAFVS